MTRRSRIVAYGSTSLLIVVGVVLAAIINGETGQVIALVLVGVGAVGLVGLVFLEVGLSEDRERERERRRAERADHPERRWPAARDRFRPRRPR